MTFVLAPMTIEGRNAEFAAYVEKLADGRSSRELSRLTRANGNYVNPTTIADARWGTVPGYGTLGRLAAGLALSPAETSGLFQAAGYGRHFDETGRSQTIRVEMGAADTLIPAEGGSEPENLVRSLVDRAEELTYEPDLENVRAEGIEGRVPAEDVEKANRIFRSIISEMARRQGRE